MRRILLHIAILFLLTSCTGYPTQMMNPTPNTTVSMSPSDIVSSSNDGYDDFLVYPGISFKNASNSAVGRLITSFAIDENGVVYIAGTTPDQHDNHFATVIAYNMAGIKLAEYEIETNYRISHLCVNDGMMYFTKSSDNQDVVQNTEGIISSYNLETGELSKLDIPTDIFALPDAIKKLVFLDGKLYILGIEEGYITNEYDDWYTAEGSDYISYNFKYDGRILAAYDITDATLEIVFDNLIQDFAPTPYGTIILQIYDPDYDLAVNQANSRFYFAELYPQSMSLGERIYRDIPHPASFATDGQGVIFTANGGSGLIQIGNLYYWPFGENMGISSDLGRDVSRLENDAISYYKGFTFYLSSTISNNGYSIEFEQDIMRVRNSAYIDFTAPIQIIGTNLYGELPRGGHSTAFNMLEYDEVALSVLSGGEAYDIAYIGARQDFAYNMRDKGAFYPLNDVPGVKEYLDKCFPYIKDAATDKNGDIWMLPMNVNVDAIIYQNQNCKEAGIDFENAATVEDVIANVRKAYELDPKGMRYRFNTATLLQKSLLRYTRSGSLDSPDFRKTAEALKGFAAKPAWGGGLLVSNADFLFDNFAKQTSQQIIKRDDLCVTPVTGSDGIASADCVFLCVNPDSNKMDRTLLYIQAVCESALEKNSSTMFKDSSVFSGSEYAKQLYALYANSIIDFNLSDEVFADVFDKYLNDEISLDELIKEADRKLRMYRGE